MFKKIIKGRNCSLVQFKSGDEKLVDLLSGIFNEKETEEYINPEYLNYRTKPKIRKWIKKKLTSPVDVWYAVKWKEKYVGYVCFKWRRHYDEACEISTAVDKNYRGLKLGYESSKIMIDYILSLNKFKYIVGYVHRENIRAENNLRKIGFRKAQRLQKIVTKEFYHDDGTSCTGRKYVLFAIYTKSGSS